MVGVAGYRDPLSAIKQELEVYDSNAIQHSRCPWPNVEGVAHTLGAMTLARAQTRAGLDEKRADVMSQARRSSRSDGFASALTIGRVGSRATRGSPLESASLRKKNFSGTQEQEGRRRFLSWVLGSCGESFGFCMSATLLETGRGVTDSIREGICFAPAAAWDLTSAGHEHSGAPRAQ